MTDPNSLSSASGPDLRTQLPESLLLAQLERGFGDLQFVPALEKPFRRYLRSYLIHHLRLACVAGLILVAAAQLLSSFVLNPPATALRWQAVLLCGVLTPVLLNAYWTLTSAGSERRMDIAAYSVIGVLSLAGLLLPMIYRHHGGVFPFPLIELVVVLIPILAARRFPVALLCVLGILGALMLRDMVFARLTTGTMLEVFNVTAFAAVSLAGGFVQEWVLRRNFLSEGLYLLRSVRDPLTQLRNRRGFDVDAERIWATARRGGLSVGVAMIDIDHFKLLNDAWGHAAGDRVLRDLANVLRAQAGRRPMDLIGRVGGEEFAVIWYDLSPGAARDQAERVRQSVVDIDLEHPGGRPLSVSIGCTQLVPRGAVTLSDALAAADSALYAAKSAGRNRVEYASPPREPESSRRDQSSNASA
ncbi:GGDEF domain-containing protein [uncultured Abyssibacter sp.]|uniref:GGDEF domain-containing protein n=1 Tax=uncultured Abyssibacter sp. TaxID=2320202 RepID=UPI0032B1DBB6